MDKATLDLFRSHTHWLIVSDLDGTLLDHFDYSHAAVDELLARLDARGVPVVLNSSKTALEMVALRREFNNAHPFIVENGSAIYVPENYFPNLAQVEPNVATQSIDGEVFQVWNLGKARADLRAFVEADAAQYGMPFLSFSRASQEELIAATGLSPVQAQQAQQRYFSEPLLWQGSVEQKQAFCQRAQAAGLNTLQGGRFLHVQGQCDKGKACQQLADLYQRCAADGANRKLIAAGDSGNDVDMLLAADIAVVIRSPVHEPPTVPNHPQVLYSTACGPAGWQEVIGALMAA